MKIGSKIALFYTLITLCTFTFIVMIFYFFTTRYIHNLYNSYLIDKAYLTAQKYWEKDEVDEYSYQKIQQKYNELLPQAQEILLNLDSMADTKDSLNKYLNDNQQAKLFKKRPITFEFKKQKGAALYYPDNEGNFIVLVMAYDQYGRKIQKHILLLAVILLLVSSGIIFLIGKIYANRILRPLQHILKELKRIRGNNLDVRLKALDNKDELDELIRALNEMLDRINIAFQAEKSFISNASHELNNPLTAIQGECEISLLKERCSREYIESLQRISTESKRISQLIKHLLFLSRQEKDILQNTMEEIDLILFLQDICLQSPRLDFKTEQTQTSIFITVNYHLLHIAIQNLIDNALKYSRDQVEVSLSQTSEGRPVIKIKDYGIGIPKEEMQHIFHSFYRAGNTREFAGQGIGLSLSMKILSVYGGRIALESELNNYTQVIVILN